MFELQELEKAVATARARCSEYQALADRQTGGAKENALAHLGFWESKLKHYMDQLDRAKLKK